MSTYTATVVWQRAPEAPFKDNKYSRAHEWGVDGGTVVPPSSSPHVGLMLSTAFGKPSTPTAR